MPLRDVCSAADLQAAAEKPLCILHVSNAGLVGSAVAQDCYVIAKLPHETFTVHVSPGAVFCINSVHQQTSASHPAAETECWELFPARWGRLGVTPPTLPGIFSPTGLQSAEFSPQSSVPTALFTATKPHSSAADFIFTF